MRVTLKQYLGILRVVYVGSIDPSNANQLVSPDV